MATEAGPFHRFMIVFERLKDWSDDDPNTLLGFAQADTSIKDLILEVSNLAATIKDKQQRSKEAFSQNSNPKFVQLFREYEERYENVSHHIWVQSLLWDLGIRNDSDALPAKAEHKWSYTNRPMQ